MAGALERGLLLLKTGIYDNVLRVLVPISATDDDLETGLEPARGIACRSKLSPQSGCAAPARSTATCALWTASTWTSGEGEFFTMLGPSGSGKTTTLRMIAGFELPTSGAVQLDGRDVTRLAPYERDVNTVFQDYALFPHMSVGDNVAYGLMVQAGAEVGSP